MITAINDATAAIMNALATMDDTVRTKLQDIVTDGTAILATEEYEQTTMPTQMLAGGRGAHDRIVTGLQKDWSKTYGSIAKGWAKFVQTVESTAISNGNPVDVAGVMSRPRFPAVNSPTTMDVTPTSIAPESPQMLMWVAMAPDGQLVVMGLAAPDADGDFDLLLDGPDGFANRLNVNPVSSAGVWNEIYDLSTPGPGSYTLSLVEASENVPFQVLAASCPASP